eukprot:7624682-Ditylum_brightwellii.AAC.1
MARKRLASSADLELSLACGNNDDDTPTADCKYQDDKPHVTTAAKCKDKEIDAINRTKKMVTETTESEKTAVGDDKDGSKEKIKAVNCGMYKRKRLNSFSSTAVDASSTPPSLLVKKEQDLDEPNTIKTEKENVSSSQSDGIASHGDADCETVGNDIVSDPSPPTAVQTRETDPMNMGNEENKVSGNHKSAEENMEVHSLKTERIEATSSQEDNLVATDNNEIAPSGGVDMTASASMEVTKAAKMEQTLLPESSSSSLSLTRDVTNLSLKTDSSHASSSGSNTAIRESKVPTVEEQSASVTATT